MGNSPGPHLTNEDDEAACSSDQDEPIGAVAAADPPASSLPPSTPAPATATASEAVVAAVPAAGEVKREVSVEMDFEDAEAASILSKVLPDMQKLTSTFADTRCSNGNSSDGILNLATALNSVWVPSAGEEGGGRGMCPAAAIAG